MNDANESKGFRISLLMKISGLFCILLLVSFIILEILSLNSIQSASLQTAMIMGRNKLAGDIASFEDKVAQVYGQLSLKNGDLVDENGNSIRNDNRVVDLIAKRLGIQTTILMKENQDYRRISTSIMDSSGKRA
ncbi:MAG: hypothetical protein FWF26_02145, partial [Treponema sp.]|nr:hypothetical protein [Treponema sp.]